MKLSVVIPTLNEEERIGRLLADLAEQQPGYEFEVIVADASSDDATVHEARRYAPALNLKVLEGITRGRPAYGHNAGAGASSAEWLLFLDADVRLPAGYLKQIIVDAEEGGYSVATTGFYPDSQRLIDRIGTKCSIQYMRLFERTRYPMASGFCILARRKLHEQMGGFNEELLLAEDHNYAIRAVEAGGRYAFLARPALQVSLRRFRKYGRLSVIGKYIAAEFYRFTHGFEVGDGIISYEFGQHDNDQGTPD